MKTLASLLAGAVTGVAAVFLHLFLPPFGLALAVIGTFTSIWAVGEDLESADISYLQR